LILASTCLRDATEALMASTTRIDELKKKFDENPRRYFAPLANEFRKSGEIDQAIMICEEFLPQQPGHMSGHIVYGQALYEAGRLPEARGVFETALGLDPENLIALRHLGDIARSQHEATAARSWYVRVLDADPRNEEIQALIAGLDADDPLMPDVDLLAGLTVPPPVGLGIDFDKESSPFDQAPASTIGAQPFDQVPARQPAETTFDQLPMSELAARRVIDLSLAETAPSGVPVIRAAPVAPAAVAPELLDGFSLHGFEDATDHDGGVQHATRAEGFESAEFAPPAEHVPLADLDATLDNGVPSFSSPEHPIQALDGLEGSGGQAHTHEDPWSDARTELEPLDLEGGLILPSDAVEPRAIAGAPSLDAPASADDLLDFDLSAPAVPPDQDSWPDGGRREGDDELLAAEGADESMPVELPPEVIAAEAKLIAAGETPEPSAPDEDTSEHLVRPPFVTETMAELYLAQGFREQALAVYTDLLAASPGDERLSGIVASLAPSRAVEHADPNVRDFFARIANRRPGEIATSHEPPADGDFGPADGSYGAPDVEPEPEPEPSYAEPDASYAEPEASFTESEAFSTKQEPLAARDAADVAPAIERVAAMQQADGSIDALFGNRNSRTSDDSAAAALAQAFGGGADIAVPPTIQGRPARAAEGELSLDSVFRDGPARPARTSQSFSFDQFFAGAQDRAARSSPPRGTAVPVEAQEAPAERGADDIEQFNSWLQGLKQR
jgi:hypothetical protein